jgi:histidyl-tRNA synthetase
MQFYSLVADAEVMYVVSEIIAELPGLQEHQFSIQINHTSLLSAILMHCSVSKEKHGAVLTLLHKMVVSEVELGLVHEPVGLSVPSGGTKADCDF